MKYACMMMKHACRCAAMLVGFVLSLLLVGTSCSSSSESKPITEELSDGELQQLDAEKAKHYEWIRKGLADLPEAMKVNWVNVKYDEMFKLLSAIENRKEEWEQQGIREWKATYAAVFDSVQNYIDRWRQWEIANRLENKVKIELKRVELTGTSLHTDLQITSLMGEICSLEGSFDLAPPELNATGHYFYLPKMGANEPFVSKLITNYATYGWSPEELEQMPLAEIPFRYEIKMVKTPETYIRANDHLDEVPEIVKTAWREMKATDSSFTDLENFYSKYVPTIAADMGLEYKTSEVYLEEYFSRKRNEISPEVNKVYQTICFYSR